MSRTTATLNTWIFDLGNTLMSIPQEADEEECIARVLGMPDSDAVRSIIYRICDRHPKQSVEEFLRRFNAAVNPSNDDAIRTTLLETWKRSVDAAVLTTGALEILDELRKRGAQLALVSNTPPTTHWIIDRLHLRERFDAIVFSCDAGFLKPDPRIFQKALKMLVAEPNTAVVVGDKIRTDILGGAILGLRSILVETRMRSIVENGQNYVDAIVPSAAAIRDTRLYKEAFA